MTDAKKMYYEKRGAVLVQNLRSRHFDAWYCPDKASALEKALELIPADARVGWGGAHSAEEIGLMEAVIAGDYRELDRNKCATPEARVQCMKDCLTADVFLTGANAMSLDGQMVNIDGTGNRLAAICYGPEMILVIVGMNKVMDNLENAIVRARTVAAPMNKQRFPNTTPCEVTGSCADCKSAECICNQILVTRNCRPAGRIKFVLVGEELGF